MNFSQSALEKLNATTPGLSKYVVAFKDMTSEMPENSGVEVGVFVLKNGGSQFFIPVISKGGVLYPIDSIYLADRKSFLPLTKKTVEQVRTTQNENVGRPSKTPVSAIRNPDMKDLVVPPRTGKFMYASDGRLEGIITLADPVLRNELADTLEKLAYEDVLVDSYDVKGMVETLRSIPEMTFTKSAVEVITDGEALSHQAVQNILEKGYHVSGEHAITRVAVESSGAHSFTTLKGAEGGHAYRAPTVFGEDIGIAILPEAKGLSGQGVNDRDRVSDRSLMVVTDRGEFARLPGSTVVHQQEVSYDDIIDSLESLPAAEGYHFLENNRNLIFCDGTGYFVLEVIGKPQMSGDQTNYEGIVRLSNGRDLRATVTVLPMHGNSSKVPNEFGGLDIFLNTSCKVYQGLTFSLSEKFQNSLSAAITRQEHRATSVLPEYHTLAFEGGTYALDGRMLGTSAKAIETLVKDLMLQPRDAESFMKSASDNKVIGIHMSKTAEASMPTPITDYGMKLPEAPSLTGSAQDRQRGQSERIQAAAKTKDREVIEMSIITELLNDPNMYHTIGEYLPEIQSAVDRLGRILFLVRLSSNKLSDTMDPEALSGMVTNLKNSYSNLGESLLKLEQISSNV